MSRACSLFGPRETRSSIDDTTGGHQGALVDLPIGEFYGFVMLDAGPNGRVTNISPVFWEADWPIWGTPDAPDRVPDRAVKPIQGWRRGRRVLGGPVRRSGGKGPVHLARELFERGGGGLQAVCQDKDGDAAFVQRLRDFPTFIAHRQPPKAAARRANDGGAVRDCRVGQEGRHRRLRDVPRHRIPPLAEPRFRGRLVVDTAGIQQYRIRLVGRFHWIHCAVLRRAWRCRATGNRGRQGCQQGPVRKAHDDAILSGICPTNANLADLPQGAAHCISQGVLAPWVR